MNLQQFRQQYPQYDDLSDKELADKLYNSNYSDMDRSEFDQKIGYTPAPTTPQPQKSSMDQVLDVLRSAGDAISGLTVEETIEYLNKNGSLPGGIGGTIAGGIIGFLSPLPGGALVGSIVGGSIGSGAGSYYSDGDVQKALTEAALSLGMDIATLGIARIGKPLLAGAKKLLKSGVPPEEVVKRIASGDMSNSKMLPDVAESQEILQKEGMSLTPFQTGIAPKFEITKENIGRTGFFGKNVFANTQERIQELVRSRMSNIIGQGSEITNDVLGKGLMDAFEEGRNVTVREYGDSLGEISKTLSKTTISLNPLKNSLKSFVNRKENLDALGNSKLDEKTLGVIDTLNNLMGENVKGSAKFLLDFEQAVNKQIAKVSSFSPSFDPTVARELTSLAKRVKTVVRTNITKVDKEAGSSFRKLQKAYGDTLEGIYPKINQKFIDANNSGGFTALGAMFAQPGKVENVQAVMRSIDKAYSKIPSNKLNSMVFSSAKEAKQAIARGYIQTVIKNPTRPDFDLSDYSKVAETLKNPTEAKKIKAILGANYSSFRKTVNLMANASKKPESGLATLFLRSKEFTAAGGLAAAGATGLMPASTAVVSAGTILLGPIFLARASVNPKYVNKLIKINELGNKPEQAAKLAMVLIDDVVDDAYAEGMGDDNIIKMLKGD